MTIEDDIACLETVPTFSILGPHALRILAIGCESKPLGEGEILFKAGEPADCGYVVRDGTFRLEPARRGNASASAEAAPVTIGPGGLLGELALIIETTRPVTAIAEEPAVVMRISRHLFSKTLEGFPDAAERLRDHMAERARETASAFSQVRAQLGAYDAVAQEAVQEAVPENDYE
jgi:CRP-like cAMP-binding protein